MKFNSVVGNPPYQKKTQKDNKTYPSIYPLFYNLAEKIGERYCLISPARFLFDAGNTDKNWNKKMLNDEHIFIEYYEPDSKNVFSNVDIKGGVVILY